MFFLIFLFLSCNNKKQLFWETYEKSLKEKDYQLSILNLDKIIEQYGNDPMAAKAQHAKASLYNGYINNYQLAIEEYQKVIDNYPESKYVANSHFLKCFILNNNIQSYTDAMNCYNDFINKYPNSDFIDDAQSELKELSGQKTIIDSLINLNK